MQLLRKIRNLNHVKGELSNYEVLGKLAHLSNWFRIRNSSRFLVHRSALSPSSTPRISSFSFEFSRSFLYSLLRSGYLDGQFDNWEGYLGGEQLKYVLFAGFFIFILHNYRKTEVVWLFFFYYFYLLLYSKYEVIQIVHFLFFPAYCSADLFVKSSQKKESI